jgi:hypothetical protein
MRLRLLIRSGVDRSVRPGYCSLVAALAFLPGFGWAAAPVINAPAPKLNSSEFARLWTLEQKSGFRRVYVKYLLAVQHGRPQGVRLQQTSGSTSLDQNVSAWIRQCWSFRSDYSGPCQATVDLSGPVLRSPSPLEADVQWAQTIQVGPVPAQRSEVMLEAKVRAGKIVEIRVVRGTGQPFLDLALIRFVRQNWQFAADVNQVCPVELHLPWLS